MKKDLAKYIRRAILRKYPSVGAFAASKENKLPEPSVYIIARGDRMPGLDRADTLTESLGVSLDYLVGNTDHPKPPKEQHLAAVQYLGDGDEFVVCQDPESCKEISLGDGVFLEKYNEKMRPGIYAFEHDGELIFRKITRSPDGYRLHDRNGYADYTPRKRNLPAYKVKNIIKKV